MFRQRELKWHYGPQVLLGQGIDPKNEAEWMSFQAELFPKLVPSAETGWNPVVKDEDEIRGNGLFFAPFFADEPVVARWVTFTELDAWLCEIFTPWGQKAVFVHYVYRGERYH